MKGLNKLVLVSAIAALPLAAQAELKSIDDAAMAAVSGQSGLVIEAGFGSTDKSDLFDVDWSGAGIKIDHFKWEVDAQLWDKETNNVTSAVTLEGAEAVKGGFIASGIAIAGAVDMRIDAVGDGEDLAAVLGAGALPTDGTAQTMGGIGITFEGSSKIDFGVADMGVYVASGNGVTGGQLSSFGSIEVLGMDISGLELVIRGTNDSAGLASNAGAEVALDPTTYAW